MATVAIQQPVLVAEPSVITSVSVPGPSKEEPTFDASDIKRKYGEERDKRLHDRPEGNEQYKQFNGIFSKYLTDSYTPRVERQPMDIETDFLVLGGGFGGLCVGARLMEAGITNMRIMDKAGDFGGTWYWNVGVSQAALISYLLRIGRDILEQPVILVSLLAELLGHSRGLTLIDRGLYLHASCRRDWLYTH